MTDPELRRLREALDAVTAERDGWCREAVTALAELDHIAAMLPDSDLDIVSRVRLALDEADYYRDALADLHRGDYGTLRDIQPGEHVTASGARFTVPPRPPRYDDVYHKGTARMDAIARGEIDDGMEALYRETHQDAPQSTRAATLPETRERSDDGICEACRRPRGVERWICAECANR